jgi:hypothetical protein
LTNNSVSFQSQYSLPLGMGDLERFFVRDFFSSFAGRTALGYPDAGAAARTGRPPTPWQKLAPTMFEHLVPAERGFPIRSP